SDPLGLDPCGGVAAARKTIRRGASRRITANNLEAGDDDSGSDSGGGDFGGGDFGGEPSSGFGDDPGGGFVACGGSALDGTAPNDPGSSDPPLDSIQGGDPGFGPIVRIADGWVPGSEQEPFWTLPASDFSAQHLNGLLPLMEAQEHLEVFLTNHVVIPAAVIVTGAYV